MGSKGCGGREGSSVREGKGEGEWVIEIRLGDVDASAGACVLRRWKAALRGWLTTV